MKVFKYEDADCDIRIELNFNLLTIKVIATTYNFNGEVVSRNKLLGWWSARNKKKFFNILDNCISTNNMPSDVKEDYKSFVDKLKKGTFRGK